MYIYIYLIRGITMQKCIHSSKKHAPKSVHTSLYIIITTIGHANHLKLPIIIVLSS